MWTVVSDLAARKLKRTAFEPELRRNLTLTLNATEDDSLYQFPDF